MGANASMTTGSTASSGTEGLDPQEPGEARDTATPPPDAGVPESTDPSAVDDAPDEEVYDPARRAFFLQFGKQAVSAVGQVAGMADLVSRTSTGVATELLGLGEPEPAGERPEFTRSGSSSPVVSAAAPAAEDAFRSAYRLAGDELVLLDQRGIPESLDEVAAKRGSDVAYYLRLGVVRGGPVMAQVAAYGLALTAKERAEQPGDQRDVELRRTQRALVEARPSARLPAWSMERMGEALAGFDEQSPGEDVATALRAEADAIATDIGAWQAAVAGALAELLPSPGGRPLAVLVHGDQGALGGGLVGTGLSALRQLRDAGRELRVFVTEGRPFMDGARLASWELRQAGLEHKIVPDAAVAWLLEREPLDAILVSAEWVAANGDVGALVGSRGIAQLAAAATPTAAGKRPRLIVSGISATLDPATPDGAAIPVEMRPAKDLSTYLANVPIRASDALVPACDVIPAADISAMVSEHGVTTPGGPR